MIRYLISGHAYDMTNNSYNAMIKGLKKKMRGKHVILALEKDKVAMARNDEYRTREELMSAVNMWRDEGYRVIYNLGK